MSRDIPQPSVAVVDYGVGNLFSVMQACRQAGLRPLITDDRDAIWGADAVILPGIGAFGDAMAALERRDLVGVLRDVAASDKWLVGICLGMQLLMSESYEFGRHRGLGVLEGLVTRLTPAADSERRLKVPQVGWNRIWKRRTGKPGPGTAAGDPWADTPLAGVEDGAFMYFVHSFHVTPANPGVVVATTPFGEGEYCSAYQQGTVFGCQFHPERSGPVGLRMYEALARLLSNREITR